LNLAQAFLETTILALSSNLASTSLASVLGIQMWATNPTFYYLPQSSAATSSFLDEMSVRTLGEVVFGTKFPPFSGLPHEGSMLTKMNKSPNTEKMEKIFGPDL
jgi:hypothetical protein